MKRVNLLMCLEAGVSVAEAAADVSVWIPTQFGRIVCPPHLSLFRVQYQTDIKELIPSP